MPLQFQNYVISKLAFDPEKKTEKGSFELTFLMNDKDSRQLKNGMSISTKDCGGYELTAYLIVTAAILITAQQHNSDKKSIGGVGNAYKFLGNDFIRTLIDSGVITITEM